jgi:hypothetical protein
MTSLQICHRSRCEEARAGGWDSISNIKGTPRPTRDGFCSWCWSEIEQLKEAN